VREREGGRERGREQHSRRPLSRIAHYPRLCLTITWALTASLSRGPLLPLPSFQVDPFFVPTTEEEREEHGEEGVGGHSANVARRLMDAVRR
jgi:hypothetical protein